MSKETHDNFMNLVSKMIELQDEYFENGKKQGDLIRYKIVKKQVKDYISQYEDMQKAFYCETNLDSEGKQKCKFQCDKCKESCKSNQR